MLAKEEEQVVAEGQVSPEALAKVRLDLAILKDVRRDLESRVAKMQVKVRAQQVSSESPHRPKNCTICMRLY